MKAWIVYWSERVFHTSIKVPTGGRIGGGEEKTHGCTAVVSDTLVSAVSIFNKKFPDRIVSSINSEADEVLFDD